MDKVDLRLLQELDKDPRITTSKLAKKLRVSQQVANYRLNRLIEDKVIIKFGTIINLKNLKQEHYRVFFKFHPSKFRDKEIFEWLKAKRGIYWASRIGGKYDLLIVLFVENFDEFDRFIDELNKRFPGLVKDYTSCYALDHAFYKHKYMSRDFSTITYASHDPVKDIDELDYYILSRIKDNCRLSALELSKGKDVSYKTIINRIKSMEKRGIILGYRLFLKEMDKKRFVLLFSFKDYSKDSEKRLRSFLAQHDEVTQTLRLFGVFNLFAHVRTDDNEKLQKLIIELRDKFEIIKDYEIIPVFEDISINLMPL